MHEPHDPSHCPACASNRIVRGSIGGRGESGARAVADFRPSGLRMLATERSVRLMAGHRFFACIECDLVWSTAIPKHLALLIDASGGAALRQRLLLDRPGDA